MKKNTENCYKFNFSNEILKVDSDILKEKYKKYFEIMEILSKNTSEILSICNGSINVNLNVPSELYTAVVKEPLFDAFCGTGWPSLSYVIIFVGDVYIRLYIYPKSPGKGVGGDTGRPPAA